MAAVLRMEVLTGVPSGGSDGRGGTALALIPFPTIPLFISRFLIKLQASKLSLVVIHTLARFLAASWQNIIGITTDALNITAHERPMCLFIPVQVNDAIDVTQVNGNNILDGGTGSNFLTGGYRYRHVFHRRPRRQQGYLEFSGQLPWW